MHELPEDLILEEVAPDRHLVQEMEKFLPHSHQLVSMVQLHLRYQHFPLMCARVFTPRCTLLRYKMVVITNIGTADYMSSMSLFWSPDHLLDGTVRQLLKSLPGFNWKRTILIRQLPLHLHQNLDQIIGELSGCSLVAELALPILILKVENSTHEIPSLPEGYYAGPLKENHGKKVITGWVGSFGENEEVFSRILERLPAVGIFKTRELSPKHQNKPRTTLGTESGAQTNSSSESSPGRMIETDTGAQSYNTLECTTAATADEGAMSFTAGKSECSIVSVPGIDFTREPNVPDDTPITTTAEMNDVTVANVPDKTPITTIAEMNDVTVANVPDDTPITTTAEMNNVTVANSNETNDSPDELVSWSVLKQGADIGMTYTSKGHRKLGLAKVATFELIRRVLDNKLNAFVMVTEDNAISIEMHKKLGFKEYTTDIILMYSPKKCNGDDISGGVPS